MIGKKVEGSIFLSWIVSIVFLRYECQIFSIKEKTVLKHSLKKMVRLEVAGERMN